MLYRDKQEPENHFKFGTLSHSGAKHQKSEHYSRPFLRLQECTLNLSEDLQNRNLSRYLHIQKIYVSKISSPPSGTMP